MIILSILLVPFFVLTLLSVVFVIGVKGSASTRTDNLSDMPFNEAETFITHGQTLPPS